MFNMKRFLIAGIIVVLVPLLGIPIFWKTWLLVLIGLYIIFNAITYSKKSDQDSRKEDLKVDIDKVFVENENKFEE